MTEATKASELPDWSTCSHRPLGIGRVHSRNIGEEAQYVIDECVYCQAVRVTYVRYEYGRKLHDEPEKKCALAWQHPDQLEQLAALTEKFSTEDLAAVKEHFSAEKDANTQQCEGCGYKWFDGDQMFLTSPRRPPYPDGEDAESSLRCRYCFNTPGRLHPEDAGFDRIDLVVMGLRRHLNLMMNVLEHEVIKGKR